MPEPSEVFGWSLQREGNVEHMLYDPEAATLRVNEEVIAIEANAASIFHVLVSHPDAPVTPEDFQESGIPTRGSFMRKGMKQLRENPFTDRHVLQVGENAAAVYAFVTNPEDVSLLALRMEAVHEDLYGESASADAERSRRRLVKIAKVAAGVGSAAASYAILRHVRRRSKNN